MWWWPPVKLEAIHPPVKLEVVHPPGGEQFGVGVVVALRPVGGTRVDLAATLAGALRGILVGKRLGVTDVLGVSGVPAKLGRVWYTILLAPMPCVE